MRLFFELAKKSFQRQMAYRAATIAGLLTNLFFGMLRASVMVAVFVHREEVAGYDLSRAITFTALTQALIAPIQIWNWRYVLESIKTGAIVSDLTKPMDYYAFWLAQDLGRVAYQTLFRGLPIVLLYSLVFPLILPESAVQGAVFFLSLVMAVLLGFSWNFLINLSAFWVVDSIGVIRLANLSLTFLSGFLVPAAFFPAWLKLIARLTPFPSIINTPVEIFLGIARGPAALQMLGEQFLWLLILVLMGRWVLHRGTRKLVIQGG